MSTMIVRKELRASFSMPPKVKRLIFLHQYPVNGLKQSTIILSFITGIESRACHSECILRNGILAKRLHIPKR